MIDVKKGELTLRFGDEAVHFNLNLNHSLKQPKLSDAECEIVEMKIPNYSEMMKDCNFQNSMNENEKNFQYLEIEFLDPNVKLNKGALSVEKNNAEKSNSYKEEGVEESTSSEGLILKELPEHLKYAFLQPKKGNQSSLLMD